MWAVGHLCVWQTCMVYARGLGHRVKLWLYTCTRFVRFTHDPCTTGAEEGMVPDLCVDSVTVLMELSKHTANSPHVHSQFCCDVQIGK